MIGATERQEYVKCCKYLLAKHGRILLTVWRHDEQQRQNNWKSKMDNLQTQLKDLKKQDKATEMSQELESLQTQIAELRNACRGRNSAPPVSVTREELLALYDPIINGDGSKITLLQSLPMRECWSEKENDQYVCEIPEKFMFAENDGYLDVYLIENNNPHVRGIVVT